MLAVLAEVDESDTIIDVDVTGKVEYFAYGAFWMKHPDDVKKVADSRYSAGQYQKGTLSIGAMLWGAVDLSSLFLQLFIQGWAFIM